jgi:hypothetical protein
VRPYLEKILHKKRADGVAQGEGPEFKPQYHKTNKQTNKNPKRWFIMLLMYVQFVVRH